MTAFSIASGIADIFRTAPGGVGGVPRDTGLLQDNSINALEESPLRAVVAIGGERGALAYYAYWLEFSENVGAKPLDSAKEWKKNVHQGWVERVITSYVLPYLETL